MVPSQTDQFRTSQGGVPLPSNLVSFLNDSSSPHSNIFFPFYKLLLKMSGYDNILVKEKNEKQYDV